MNILRAIAHALALPAPARQPCRLRDGFMGMSCDTCGGDDFGGRFACAVPGASHDHNQHQETEHA